MYNKNRQLLPIKKVVLENVGKIIRLIYSNKEISING